MSSGFTTPTFADRFVPAHDILQAGRDVAELIQQVRRDIHAHPETGLELPHTQARVLTALQGLDLDITLGQKLSSVVAVLRGGRRDLTNPVAVILRGDMDALPVKEETGFSFAAHNGNMHACGHDLHTAGLVGAAHVLHRVKEQLAGDVIFMFQPGEEGYDGAGIMLEENVLGAAGVPVVAAYGVHVSADQPAGHLYSKPGSYMAASHIMHVTVHGRGGHGARPEAALDPIQVAASLVGQLQELLSRRFFAWDPVVLTVGEFHAGTAPNVIPDSARLGITVRSFSAEAGAKAAELLPRLVTGVVEAHGLQATVSFAEQLPATINDAAENAFYLDAARAVLGAGAVHVMEHPRVGSEDFSRVLAAVPGSYGHFGVALPHLRPEQWEANHSARARHTDSVLDQQAAFLASVAFARLAAHQDSHPVG